MTPINLSQSRTAELWRRFAGLFGGEALSRKFGDKPPVEWVGVVGGLKDYELERGMRRLVRSGKAGVPSLPEFSRMCREVANDADESTRPALPAPADSGFDRWDISANRHLMARTMAHVLSNDSELPAKVAKRCQAKNAWAADMRDLAANNGGTVPVETQRAIWADYMRGVA